MYVLFLREISFPYKTPFQTANSSPHTFYNVAALLSVAPLCHLLITNNKHTIENCQWFSPAVILKIHTVDVDVG